MSPGSRAFLIPWSALATCGMACGPGYADPVPFLELPVELVRSDLLPDAQASIPIPVRNIGTATAFIDVVSSSLDGSSIDVPSTSFRLEPGEDADVVVVATPAGYDAVVGQVDFSAGGNVWSVEVRAAVADDADDDGFDAVEVGGEDCDDLDPAVAPDQPERCNGLDDDCDGDLDEGLPLQAYWPDDDGDGHGDGGEPSVDACERPMGYAEDSEDCNDTDPDVSPSAEEIWYDDVDQDCSGTSDFDQDQDGVDAAEHGGADCDDTDEATYPGAPELSDGNDNDCDTFLDEDIIATGDLIFTELFVRPSSGTPGAAEWVEVHNLSATHADLGLVEMEAGGGRFPLATSPTLLPPAGIWLACVDTDPSANGGVVCDGASVIATQATGFALFGPDGLIDAVDTTGFTTMVGRSSELDATQYDAVSNDGSAAWCVGISLFGDSAGDRGTPGALLPPCP